MCLPLSVSMAARGERQTVSIRKEKKIHCLTPSCGTRGESDRLTCTHKKLTLREINISYAVSFVPTELLDITISFSRVENAYIICVCLCVHVYV